MDKAGLIMFKHSNDGRVKGKPKHEPGRENLRTSSVGEAAFNNVPRPWISKAWFEPNQEQAHCHPVTLLPQHKVVFHRAEDRLVGREVSEAPARTFHVHLYCKLYSKKHGDGTQTVAIQPTGQLESENVHFYTCNKLLKLPTNFI